MKDLFDNATSILERRFLKNAFLPTLVFPLAVAAPWVLQGDRIATLFWLWSQQDAGARLLQVALYFAVSWFIAAMVASQWRNLIRLFEGYPLMRIPRVGQYCADWYWARAEAIEQSVADAASGDREDESASTNGSGADANTLYYYYPESSEDCLPTRLGNALRASERYPYYRYGLDTILLWPRLYHLLDRQDVEDVEESRAALEFLLVVASWFVAVGCVGAIGLVYAEGSSGLAITWLLLAIVLAYFAYLGAVGAAVEYGEQLRSCTELFRIRLLERFGAPPPESLMEERELWEAISDFVLVGNDLPESRFGVASGDYRGYL